MIVTTVGSQVYGDEQGSFKEIRLQLNVRVTSFDRHLPKVIVYNSQFRFRL